MCGQESLPVPLFIAVTWLKPVNIIQVFIFTTIKKTKMIQLNVIEHEI